MVPADTRQLPLISGYKFAGRTSFFLKTFLFVFSSSSSCETPHWFDGCAAIPRMHFLPFCCFVLFFAVTQCPSGCETLGKPNAIAAAGAGLANIAADTKKTLFHSHSFFTGEQEDPEAQQEGRGQGDREEGQGGRGDLRARRLLQGPGRRGRS